MMKSNFSLQVTSLDKLGRACVRNHATQNTSRIYTIPDAEELLYWLRDRETGYQLTDEKIKCILSI
jgi:hypothetical protein